MADSANILSILASLAPPPGADAPDVQLPGVQQNVMQAMAPPPQPAPPSSEDIYHAATADAPPTPTAPARARSSLLDKIGRVADVLATVGGATPLYQPTLDSRQDRLLALGDHDRKVSADDVALATSKFDLGDKTNTRLGMAARGLQAIKAAGGDINVAWPELAARMQIDPQTAAAVAHDLQTNPNALDGLIAATTDPKYDQSKYGGDLKLVTGPDGKLTYVQANLSEGGAQPALPSGYTAVDPMKYLNLGGQTVGVGSYNPTPKVILPNTVNPNTAATTRQSDINNRRTTQTQLEIAGMPARAQAGENTAGSDPSAGLQIISDIQQGFDNLHRLKALPGDTSNPIGAVEGALGRTRLGQAIGATTGLSQAAQERELLAKNLANLQSDLIKSLPGNATRTRFEQEIQKKRLPDPTTMSYDTANRAIKQIRDAYMTALRSQPSQAVNNLQKLTPEQAAKLAPGTAFIGLDGIQRVRH